MATQSVPAGNNSSNVLPSSYQDNSPSAVEELTLIQKVQDNVVVAFKALTDAFAMVYVIVGSIFNLPFFAGSYAIGALIEGNGMQLAVDRIVTLWKESGVPFRCLYVCVGALTWPILFPIAAVTAGAYLGQKHANEPASVH